MEWDVKAMRMARKKISILVARWKRGDQTVIAEIDRRINEYSDLRDKYADIAMLADHPGFQLLLSAMLENLDRDLWDLPEMHLRDKEAGTIRATVNSVGQMMFRRFIGLWRSLDEEHKRGARKLQEELNVLHHFNKEIGDE